MSSLSSSSSPLPSYQLHQALAILRSCYTTGLSIVLLDPTVNASFVNSSNLLLRHLSYLSVDQQASLFLALSSQSEPHEQLQLRRTKEAQGQELRTQIDAILSQQSLTVNHVSSSVDNINAQVAKTEKVEAHLRKLKENLQNSSMELKKAIEQDYLQSKKISCLERELSTCESELKDCEQVIDTQWSLLASIFS